MKILFEKNGSFFCLFKSNSEYCMDLNLNKIEILYSAITNQIEMKKNKSKMKTMIY